MVAGRRERWLEAAASIRLAIAFDPWNAEFKEVFADMQSKVHQVRAAELLERADASWDASAQQEALRLYEEALHYRPCDASANHRAAQLSLDLGENEKAREYAENACELEPEAAEYQVTLGRALRASGMREKARQALDAALRLDPGSQQARAEHEALRRNSRRRR